jgi:hypothetical protein
MRKARIVSTRSQPAQQPKAGPTKARRLLRMAAVWCGLGFVSGAAFWHFVGFWSFLSEEILDRTLSATPAAAAIASQPAGPDQPPIVVVDTNRCTMLTLDRRTNYTRALPCPTGRLAMRFVPETGIRADRASFRPPQIEAAGYRAD